MARQTLRLILMNRLARRLRRWAHLIVRLSDRMERVSQPEPPTEGLPEEDRPRSGTEAASPNTAQPPGRSLTRTEHQGPPAHWLARIRAASRGSSVVWSGTAPRGTLQDKATPKRAESPGPIAQEELPPQQDGPVERPFVGPAPRRPSSVPTRVVDPSAEEPDRRPARPPHRRRFQPGQNQPERPGQRSRHPRPTGPRLRR